MELKLSGFAKRYRQNFLATATILDHLLLVMFSVKNTPNTLL